LSILIESEGFEPYALALTTPEASTLDCGAIELVPLTAGLTLAAGHRLDPGELRWRAVGAILPEIGFTCFDIRWARKLADGSLSIHLVRAEGDPTSFRAWSPTAGQLVAKWPAVLPPEIVVDCNNDAATAFRLSGDGYYERVEMRRHSMNLDLAPQADPVGKFRMGWQWSGIPCTVYAKAGVHPALEQSLEFNVPEGGAHLWWQLDGAQIHDLGPVEGFQKLEIP
jgi:hypothetical protein